MSEKSVAEFRDVISGLQQVKATLATICRTVENGETDASLGAADWKARRKSA